MRILVTGGAGFIGSHLCEALLRRGDEVVALDDLSAGSPDNLPLAIDRVGFRLVEGSVLDHALVERLVGEADAVVHLAAILGVRRILHRPYRSLQANVQGTETVIEAATRRNRRTIIASTSEVYGKNPVVPVGEDADRILGSTKVARWSYATGKAVDESLALAAYCETGLPVTVVRFFNTVGPRQSPAYGMVVPTFVRQALAEEDLTVYGTGTQTRAFCYVVDVVGGLLAILDRREAVGQAFNLGSDEEVSIMKLAERVLARTGTPSRIRRVPYELAYGTDYEDVARRVPDLSKAQRLLAYEPRWSLDDILRAVIATSRGDPIPSSPSPSRHGAARVAGPSSAPDRTRSDGPERTVSVIVPIFNEALSAADTVRGIRSQPVPVELIVVNDGSTDETINRLAEVEHLIDTLIDLPDNRGKGASVRAGIEVARGEILVLQDADLELDPACIPDLVSPISSGQADSVFGSRLHAANRAVVPRVQWWANRILTALTNTIYGLRLTDMETAAKAISRDVARLLQLRSNGFEIEPEIAAKLGRIGARVKEVPLSFRPRLRSEGKKMRPRDGVRALLTLLRHRRWRPGDDPAADDIRRIFLLTEEPDTGQTIPSAASSVAAEGA